MSVKHAAPTCFGTSAPTSVEHNMPHLTSTASDKPLFTWFQSVAGSVVDIAGVQKVQFLPLLKTYG
jgi:hypothetical protein